MTRVAGVGLAGCIALVGCITLVASGAGGDQLPHRGAFVPHDDAVVLTLEPRNSQRGTLLGEVDRLQYQHRFSAAERRLSDWLAQRPEDAAARVQRAQIRLAQGNARGALADCIHATSQLDALTATACRAQALGQLGEIATARAMLEAALAAQSGSALAGDHRAPSDDVLSWASGIAGELAQRAGQPREAEAWFKRSLATAGSAHFPRIAYAEFLLAERRHGDVLALLSASPDSSAVIALRRRAMARS